MAEKKEETKTEEKSKSESYELVEVPTQTGVFVRNNKKDEVLDDKGVLLEILNKLDKIEKAVA